jgi:hypothetical protein
MQYLQVLANPAFWFNLNPGPFLPPVFIALGIFIIALFVAGGAVKFLALRARRNPPLHRVFSRSGRLILWAAVACLALYFFSYENIYFLSARFWWGIAFAGFVVWAVFVFKDNLIRYPREKAEFEEKLKREKYLPR